MPVVVYGETETIICNYATYSDENGNHKVTDKFVLTFIVDKTKKTAYSLGSQGSDEVALIPTAFGGFSFIEVIAQCPTYYGRFNQNVSSVEMLLWQKEHSISKKMADKAQVRREENGETDPLEGKFVTGVLADRDIPEYTAQYDELIKRVSGKTD